MVTSDRDDDRLDAPAFHRNHLAILAVLRRVLGSRSGDVLEIGSGTGQHIAAFAEALPQLTWWPSDPDPRHIASIAAWRRHRGAAALMAPATLDVTAADWNLGGTGLPSGRGLTAILCVNVLHIAPWAVAEALMRGAGRHLGPDGRLILYGPYSRDHTHTAPSNAAFDAALRTENPDWGVRDITEITALAKSHGLMLADTIEMPANNLCLVLRRAERQP